MNYLQRDTYGMYRGLDLKKGPGPALMGAGTLTGNDVSNTKGENLGEIKEIMLDMDSGRVAYAVLSFGGIFGVGDKLFAVPWKALRLDTKNHEFRLDVDKKYLESAPGFDKDDWPSMSDRKWQTDVHSYYRTTPYWEEMH